MTIAFCLNFDIYTRLNLHMSWFLWYGYKIGTKNNDNAFCLNFETLVGISFQSPMKSLSWWYTLLHGDMHFRIKVQAVIIIISQLSCYHHANKVSLSYFLGYIYSQHSDNSFIVLKRQWWQHHVSILYNLISVLW